MIKHCGLEKVGVEQNVAWPLNKMNWENVVRETKYKQDLTGWSSEYKDFLITVWEWPGWCFQVQQWVTFLTEFQESEGLPNEPTF